MNAYTDPNSPPVETFEAHEADSANEQTRFGQDTALFADISSYAQHTSSVQVFKNIPGCLYAKLLEQPEKTSVEDLKNEA